MLKPVFIAASCHVLNPFIRGPNSDGHHDSSRLQTKHNCLHVTAPSTSRGARHNDVSSSTHAAGITETRRKRANKTALIDENDDEDVERLCSFVRTMIN